MDNVYKRFESPGKADRLALEIPELQEYLAKLLSERVGVQGLSANTDFFAAGMDSLQAITARAHLMRELYLAGNVLGQNVAFEHPSITQLAAYLVSLRKGSPLESLTEEDIMRELIAKYSTFAQFKPGTQVPDGEIVVSKHLSCLRMDSSNLVYSGLNRCHWLSWGSYPVSAVIHATHTTCLLPCPCLIA